MNLLAILFLVFFLIYDLKTNAEKIGGTSSAVASPQNTGDEKQKEIEIEDLNRYLIVFDWYLDQQNKFFELDVFDQLGAYPFNATIMKKILDDIKTTISSTADQNPTSYTLLVDLPTTFNRLDDTTENTLINQANLYRTGRQHNFTNIVEKRSSYVKAINTLQPLMNHPSQVLLDQFVVQCETYKGEHLKLFAEESMGIVRERQIFIQSVKVMLSDMIGTLLIQESCKAFSLATTIMNKKIWDDFIVEMKNIDQEHISRWWQYDGFLSHYDFSKSYDIIKTDLTADVQDKSYWNTIRVYADFGNKNRQIINLLRKPSDPLFTNLKKTDDIFEELYMDNAEKPIILSWSSNREVYKKIQVPASINGPKKSRADGEALLDQFSKSVAFINLATAAKSEFGNKPKESPSPDARNGLIKIEGNAAKAVNSRGFKQALTLVGSIANYLGPLASAICGVLASFFEPGSKEVIEALQKGFAEMHVRFDHVEEQLGALSRLVELKLSEQTYKVLIQNRLQLLLLEKDNYERLRTNTTSKQELLKLCEDKDVNPYHLLFLIHDDFVVKQNTGYGYLLFNYSNYNLNILRQGLMMVVGDAANLNLLYTTTCIPLSASETKTPAQLRDEARDKRLYSFQNSVWLSNITRRASDLDNQLLYDWPDQMEIEVNTIVKANPDADPTNLAKLIYEKLANKYPWNEFLINVYKDLGGGMYTFKYEQARVTHPRYGRYLRIGVWDIVVNWYMKGEGYDGDMKKARAVLDQATSYCTKISNLQEPLDNLLTSFTENDELKGLGIKSIFIRRDADYYGIGYERSAGDKNGMWPALKDLQNSASSFYQSTLPVAKPDPNGGLIFTSVHTLTSTTYTPTCLFNFGGGY